MIDVFDNLPDRDVYDARFALIARIYLALEGILRRPLRVLDLGCAQGFFSVALARLGAQVYGVDSHAPNIDFCRALAAAHPELSLRFEHALAEQVIVGITPDQYDLALGLGIFPRLVPIVGAELVRQMIGVLADACGAGLFAFDDADARGLLGAYGFVHEMLQDAARLYVGSNRYWFLGGEGQVFDTRKEVLRTIEDGTFRRTHFCYLNKEVFVKQFLLDSDSYAAQNIQAYRNEISFLQNPPPGFKAPALYSYGQHASEAWLARELVPGELLSQMIESGQVYDAGQVVDDILGQLAALEAAGLYHDDLRSWNILVDMDSHAALIDYAAVSGRAQDRGWPYNIFLSFVVLLHEIVDRKVLPYDPIRQASFDPETFPEPYRSGLARMLEADPADWRFTFLHDCFACASKESDFSARPTGFAVALRAMESAARIHHDTADFWRRHASLALSSVKKLQGDAQE